MKKRRTPRKPGEHQIKQELKHIPREWRRTSKKAGEAMRNTGDSERNTKKRRRAESIDKVIDDFLWGLLGRAGCASPA